MIDVDGITSTSVILKVFREKLNYPIEYYLPNRYTEGYGLSNGAIDVLNMLGVEFIITVDCGVSAVKEVEYAKSLGMEIIVSDHHMLSKEIPDCIIVNPHQSDCNYPNKNLAGCGVALKIACALYPNLINESDFEEYLNIVAFGSIADVVPLVDENRIIAYYGCKDMGNTTNVGLQTLIEKSNILNPKITAGQVGFTLAPKINAIGRVGKADLGVELFTTNSKEEAEKIVDELIYQNELRQQIEGKMIEQAIEVIENDESLKNGKLIFIAKSDWHTGVIGIAASKICEKYNKPTILLSINKEGICKGSGRSISCFSIFEPLMDAKPLLINGGGHDVALGMSFHLDNLNEIKCIFERHAEVLTEEDLKKVVKIDVEVNEDEITLNLCDEIGKLEPFGVGNPTPQFMVSNISVSQNQLLGKLKNHTKIKTNNNLDIMIFNSVLEDVKRGDKLDFVGNLSVNDFRGQQTAQFLARDWRFTNG
jgi:single-stranded-DNA-specific exonuclease